MYTNCIINDMIYSALRKFLNKMKIFPYNFYKYADHKWPFQTIWIEMIRPHETWGLMFDPYCLVTSIIFRWKLFILYGMTWILRISRFVNFTNCPITFGGHCMLLYGFFNHSGILFKKSVIFFKSVRVRALWTGSNSMAYLHRDTRFQILMLQHVTWSVNKSLAQWYLRTAS